MPPRLVALVAAVLLLVPACTDDPGPQAAPETMRPTTATTATASEPKRTQQSAEPVRHPHRPTSWGPTRGEVARAEQIVAGMSVDELAGQVIVAAYPGTEAPVDLVRDHHLGGVIVLTENVASAEQTVAAMDELRAGVDRPYPLWTSVDQEGGVVQRLGPPVTQFPAYMSLGAADVPRLAERVARAGAAELRAAGFVTGYAPDADVTSGPDDPTIGSRSAGADPQLVARTVAGSVRGYDDTGVISVVKHFPGHGSVPVDSHLKLPRLTASMRTLRTRDLVPFEAAIRAGVPAVMVGHLDVRAVHPGRPATLSRKVVEGLLRSRLGFEGVVVTDAMNMGAIVDRYGTGGSAVMALAAGVDVVLLPPDPATAQAAIRDAVADGQLPESRLREAASRMIALLLHTEAQGSERGRIGSHRAVSLAESRAAVTVVDGPCGRPMIGDAARPVGDSEAVAAFRSAAEALGIDTGSGPRVDLLGYASGPGRGAVVVSTDTPYALADSRAGRGKVALFGATEPAMTALLEVLTGDRRATGRLPVAVPGLSPGCPRR